MTRLFFIYISATQYPGKTNIVSLCTKVKFTFRAIMTYYYSTIAPFYHIRAKERAKYATLLHCGTGQKYGLKRSDKMAAQNEPTFALFSSSDLDFLTDEPFAEIKSNKRHFKGP